LVGVLHLFDTMVVLAAKLAVVFLCDQKETVKNSTVEELQQKISSSIGSATTKFSISIVALIASPQT
jgi:hypothetical protein